MRILLLLFALPLFVGCANSNVPQFPEDIQFHYLVEIKKTPNAFISFQNNIINLYDIPKIQEEVRCLEFEIVSRQPYKIKFLSQVDLIECNGVGGFKPSSMRSLVNWIDDVAAWAKENKKCFR